MRAFAKSFDPDSIDWHHIKGEPDDPYDLDYEYSLLGYDLAAGKLDMMMRFRPGGGYCEPHSHVAATTVVVTASRLLAGVGSAEVVATRARFTAAPLAVAGMVAFTV